MSSDIIQIEAKIISIYIGCVLRLTRLKKNLSQHELGLILDTDSVAIGRIERANHNTPWSKIYILAQTLEIKIDQLFVLKSKEEIISIIEDCHSNDSKLSQSKIKYYQNLKQEVNSLYSILEKH